MITFAIATIFLLITPGPGVLSVAGVGSGFGFRAGNTYLWGLCAGNLLVGLAVTTGLAAFIFSVSNLREILLGLSALYLAYLAAKIGFSGQHIGFIMSDRAPGFLNAIALQVINPKAYAVNTSLFTGFAFMSESFFIETFIKFAILNAIWIPIHFLWLGAGMALKQLPLSEAAQKYINIGMAVSLLLVVALAVMI